MTPETKLKNTIMADCGERGWLCFHINVGTVRLPDGSFFSTGVPKGWPDLTILTDQGQAIFIETKIKPRRPTKEQLNLLRILSEKGFVAKVVYSAEEWKNVVEEEIDGEKQMDA